MNHDTYMSRSELLAFLKLGTLCSEVDLIVKTTKDKEWRRKLKCVITYCEKILEERLSYLDKTQLESISRRRKHTKLMLLTSDQKRIREDKVEESITVETEDLYDIFDLAQKACLCCEQGEYVKTCHWREVYHRCGVPPYRTSPKEGECEFRNDNEPRYLTPQEYRVEMVKAAKTVGEDSCHAVGRMI